MFKYFRNKNTACIFASTKYQIINAIHIQMLKGFSTDLYIIDKGLYSDCMEIANRIKKEKIFNNTVYIDAKKLVSFSKYHYINSLVACLNYRKIVCSYLLPKKYNIMLFCTNSLIERLTKIYFVQSGSGTRILLYDEGVGSYTGEYERKRLNADKLLRRMLFKKDASRVYYNKLLYVPELYYRYGDSRYGKISKIPAINKDCAEIGIYSRVFEMESKTAIYEKMILMDINPQKLLNAEGKSCYCNLLRRINSLYHSNIIFKSHPSYLVKNCEEAKYYEYSNIPFELVIANSDIENKILISINSTSLITPKILFNQEPIIILLNKIMRDYLIQKDEDNFSFWERVQRIYDPNKLYIPKTEKELLSILYRLLYGERDEY